MRSCWVAVGLIVACGGATTESSNSTSSNTSATTSFATQYCDILGACCAPLGQAYNQSTCVGATGFVGGQGYDPVAGESCLAALRTASKGVNFCLDLGASDPNLLATCESVFPARGTSQPGQPCLSEKDCALLPQGPVSCSLEHQCTVQVRAKAGDPCVADHINGNVEVSFATMPTPTPGLCWDVDGLFCDPTTSTCTAREAAGATCGDDKACVVGTFCDQEKCTLTLAIGATCKDATTGCAAGFCDSTSETCQPLAALGQPCTSDPQCGTGNTCTNGACLGPSRASTAGVCN